MNTTTLIAIDWGTTSFRAYLFDQNSNIIDIISTTAGIMQLGDRSFEDVFLAQLGNWMEKYPNLPILASGMITSRQGWIETPYLSCPASLKDLSRNLTEHRTQNGQKVYFVPGVCQKSPTANIMRGEETQMAGLNIDKPVTAILPGTHSKWIRMENESIKQFSTFMTGEIFAALTQHTILSRLLTEGEDPEAFILGVGEGFSPPEGSGGILSKLFGARAMPLLELMNPESIKDYISGLLLGTEIQEAIRGGFGIDNNPIICGAAALVERYKKALEICGFKTELGKADLAAFGLYRIASSANLI